MLQTHECVQVPQAVKGVARFGFLDLCGLPLGAADYMALAGRFHTVFVTGIPAMSMQVWVLPCCLSGPDCMLVA